LVPVGWPAEYICAGPTQVKVELAQEGWGRGDP